MRVLYVNSGNLFGGIEVLLVTLARQRGLCPDMEPEFAVCFPGKARDELTAAGVPVHPLGPARASRPWTVWRVRRRLRALLRERRSDIVVCHGPWTQALFGPVVRSAGLPLVLWLHDPPGARLGWLDRWARRSPPDLTICNSRYTLEGLPRLYPGGRGECVYCPVYLPACDFGEEERRATRAAFATAPDAVVILQIGRWESHKGHVAHMHALGLLADAPDWVCWQVGGVQRPEEQAYLEGVREAARRYRVANRVRFLGYQPDVARVLAAADIYCQPNGRPEPFGITFIEAMTARLPVVATALGGPREIVDATCGILVAPGDEGALAAALARLVQDGELRRRLGTGGPARARAISDPAARLSQLAGIYVGLCDPQPAGAARDAAG
jgi:glycosyltransferase involved in cell wall biosynthesis